MDRIISIPIKRIIGTDKESAFRSAVGNFRCRDNDVESFLKNRAFDFDVRHKSRTYLFTEIMADNTKVPTIFGFFTITIKTLEFGDELSKSIIKRIDGFSKDVTSTEAVLLGQLGKDQEYQDKISGQQILDTAIYTIYKIHNLAGGRIVFLECNEHPKLVDFYSRNGFETLQYSGDYLQMIRYL